MYLQNNTPYTYFIQWSKTGMKYYGVRYAKNCNPSDLWNTYFTSSPTVTEYVQKYGNPDIIQIRKIFNNIDQARLWEHKVLKRLKVIIRDDYLNKSDSKSIDPRASSKARTGVSPGNKGKPQPDYIKDKKRKPKPLATCPHCNKVGGISAMYRFHFDKCGIKIPSATLNKLKISNQKKANRPIVTEIKQLKKSMPKSVTKLVGLKPGWYQLSDSQLENYLSSLKVLNLGNLSE
jgi:hypothetical protein